MAAEDLTLFERLRIQMEALVPVIRAFEAEFGGDAVKAVLEARLQNDLDEATATTPPQADLRVMTAGTEAYAAGDVLDYEVLTVSEDRFEMNVTRCGYAALMEELDARDLGPLLICNHDFPMALRMGAELERTQTCMRGASHCDFRYRRRSG
ncbi:MAG: L-2-amino-thiazoline-4-carboxylic acid hydrolase [Myxococcota bacterium]